jgi:hypothetical protein
VLRLGPVEGLISTAILYGGLRWAAHMTRKQTGGPATIDDLLAEIADLSGSDRLGPFRRELAALTEAVRRVTAASKAMDPGLLEFTRATLETVVQNSREIVKLPWVPSDDQSVSVRYRSFLTEAASHLNRSYATAKEKDSAMLADQIDNSTKALRDLQQQIINGG